MTEVKKTYDKGVTKKFLILIGDSEFLTRQEEELSKLASTAELKGFRKGHAPISMVKKLYEGQVKEKAINKILNEEITKIVKDGELKLAASPQINAGSEGELSFEVVLELTPNIPDDFDFSKIKAEVFEVDITPEELEKEMGLVAERNKEFKTKEGESQKGDIVVIDFEGFVDDIPFAGGKAENHELELGSASFIPGFEDQLIGKNLGEEIEVKVTFPAEYHAKNLAGKEAIFKTKIKEIKGPIIPELNEEFAKKFSLNSVEELKNNIKEKIESFYKNAYKETLKSKIFDELSKLLEFDVAEGLVERVAQDIAKEKNVEASTVQEEAAERLRLSFFLTHLGNKEKIEISEQDFTNFIIQSAGDSGMNPFSMLNFYNQNKEAKNKLLILLEENKIYDSIFDRITTSLKKISKEEFDEILKNSK